MTKATHDGLEQCWELRADYIHTIEAVLKNVHIPNWPMGLVLELRAEALEEVLRRVWETRMSLGTPGSIEPRLLPATDPLLKAPVSPKRHGRKPRATQGGLQARKRAGEVHTEATPSKPCSDAKSEPL